MGTVIMARAESLGIVTGLTRRAVNSKGQRRAHVPRAATRDP